MNELTVGELRRALDELDAYAMVRAVLAESPGGPVDPDDDRVITAVVVKDGRAVFHGDFPSGWPIDEDSELGQRMLRELEQAGTPLAANGSLSYNPETEFKAGRLRSALRGVPDDAALRLLLPAEFEGPLVENEPWVITKFEASTDQYAELHCDFG